MQPPVRPRPDRRSQSHVLPPWGAPAYSGWRPRQPHRTVLHLLLRNQAQWPVPPCLPSLIPKEHLFAKRTQKSTVPASNIPHQSCQVVPIRYRPKKRAKINLSIPAFLRYSSILPQSHSIALSRTQSHPIKANPTIFRSCFPEFLINPSLPPRINPKFAIRKSKNRWLFPPNPLFNLPVIT